MFKKAVPIFSGSFKDSICVPFEGAHAYPPVGRSSELRIAVEEFLDANWLP